MTPFTGSGRELAALILDQQRDDRRRRLPRRARTCNESELECRLDRLVPDRRGVTIRGRLTVMLVGCRPWDAVDHVAAGLEVPEHLAGLPVAGGVCPVCGGKVLRPSWLCVGCTAHGLDEAGVEWEGEGVNSRPNWEFVKEYGLDATKHQEGKLRGGKGA